MKSYNEIQKKLVQLSEADKQKIKQITEELKQFSQLNQVTQEGLKHITNLQTNLNMFAEQYTSRLISLLKQNHMLN
jgi:uncharacterized protein YpuA (DUF1002 family)